MKRPAFRAIFKVLLLLAAGAALNVAVAWGLALERHPHSELFEGGRWKDGIFCRAVVCGSFRSSSAEVFHYGGPFKQAAFNDFGPAPSDLMHEWKQFEPSSPQMASGQFIFEKLRVDARGWPALALWQVSSHAVIDADNPQQTRYLEFNEGIELPWTDDHLGGAIALPTRMIWPGFAVNTLFYAGVLWVLWASPFALRRMIRRRRGQCPACAYPIGTSEVCTECGAAVAARG